MCNKIHYGYTSSAAEYGNIKLLRITDIQHNFVDWDSVPYCEQNPVDLDSFALETNDILIARTGGTIGKSFLIKEKLDHIAVFASYLIRVVPSKLLDSNYIKVFLGTSFYWQLLTLKSMGIGQPNVNGESLKTLLIPLPPITEENNISTKVDNLEFFIKNSYISYNNISERIALAKSKLLELAIRGKLLPQDPNDEPASDLLKRIREEKRKVSAVGKSKKAKPESYIFKGDDNLYYEQIGSETHCIQDEIPFEIPKNWAWTRFGDVCELYTGNSISKEIKLKKYTNLTEGYNYIGTKDVGFDSQIKYENGVKIPKDEKIFKIAPANSILLCIEGGSAGRKIGMLTEDVCFGNKLCCYKCNYFSTKYIYLYLQSLMFKSLFASSLMGLIGGVGTSALERIYIPIPPIAEQKRIVDIIEKGMIDLDLICNLGK